MSRQFDLSRFLRLLRNDLLDGMRARLYGTLAMIGATALVYISNFEPGAGRDDPPISLVLFTIYLMGTGAFLTSVAFSDMHHPLARYQYLLLPVSNLERFLSRWLITGPLFVLYALLAFVAADAIANLLVGWLNGASYPPFAPFSAEVWINVRIYFAVHALALTGAICFRSVALVKSALFVMAWAIGLLAMGYVALRIFYFDFFSFTSFHPDESLHLRLQPLFAASWMNWLAAVAMVAWVLFVAYRCLRAHEVQDGI
jgi:hypothetical protein